MLETPHVAVGAAIASKIINPVLSIPLAFASHFILEKVPHWNPHLNQETETFGRPTKQSTVIVIIDVVLSLAIGGFVAYRALPNITHAVVVLVACLVSVLPDVVEGPHFFFGFRNKLLTKWIDFQKSIQVDTKIVPGMITQLMIILASFWWILRS